MNVHATRILSRCQAGDFVGREAELHRLVVLSRQNGSGSSVALLCQPGAGASELLRQTYDRIFKEDGGVAPIYFEVRASDETAEHSARRFLRAFLAQMIAFRRRDHGLLQASLTFDEIEQHCLSADTEWVSELVRLSRSGGEDLIRACFAAPQRALAGGAPNLVLIDGLFEAMFLGDGHRLLSAIVDAASGSSTNFAIAGPRRVLYGITPLSSMKLERLSHEDASKIVASMTATCGIAANDQTCDLIALQLDRDLKHIDSLVTSAAEKGVALDSFASVERVYTDEVFGGRIALDYESHIGRSLRRELDQKLFHLLKRSRGSITLATDWRQQLALPGDDLDRLLRSLHNSELISEQGGRITIDSSKIAFADVVDARLALSNDLPRAAAVGSAVLSNIARAPQLMSAMYRRRSAVGLREILASFGGQSVPKSALDYSSYKSQLKGLGADAILGKLSRQADRLELPKVHFAVYTADIYPQIATLSDRERSAVGMASDEAMLAVEVDSKLEATREAAEFWCDRLEMAAAANGLESVRFWLVAPEGFDDEAMELLKERNAIGSSVAQVETLRRFLTDGALDTSARPIEEFDVVVPMGEEGEVISARTIEEIGRRYELPQRALNQIKTAVVEACINAAEHSLSPDRRIYETFAIYDDRLTIGISNRGVRLADKKLRVVSTQEGRRGWGLKLMQGLMDEVHIEDTDDGTKIILTKFIDIARNVQTAAS